MGTMLNVDDGREKDRQLDALAEQIRAARASSGLTQAEIGQRVAEVMGRPDPIHQTVVGSWARGQAMPSVQQLLALDEVLGLAPGTLLARAGLIARPGPLVAFEADRLLDASAKEVLRRVYIATVDAVGRRRVETGGIGEDERDPNTVMHYMTWLTRRLRGWKSGGEPYPGPISQAEMEARYDPALEPPLEWPAYPRTSSEDGVDGPSRTSAKKDAKALRRRERDMVAAVGEARRAGTPLPVLDADEAEIHAALVADSVARSLAEVLTISLKEAGADASPQAVADALAIEVARRDKADDPEGDDDDG